MNAIKNRRAAAPVWHEPRTFCAGIVPHARDAQRPLRPDYFADFDGWLQQLEEQIPDSPTRASLLTTLDEDGRQVDLQQLAARYHLSRAAVRLIRRLVRFGDEGRPVHSFGSVCIAEIAPRARSRNVTTHVYATRWGAKVDYWWTDTAEGFGALGVRDGPLTLREAVVMVRRVVRAQARYDVIDGGDRSAYMPDRAAQLRVTSTFYPRLGTWFRSGRSGRVRSTGQRRR